jgi:hypothetical protein
MEKKMNEKNSKSRTEKEVVSKKGKFLKLFLIYAPVLILVAVFSILTVNYLLRKARITRSNYEEKLVRFYEAIVENSTNLNELVSSDFQNNETNLLLTKGNYRLFSYQFEILTNIVESNKIETAKLLYSIVVQGKESNFSVLKEAYFDTSNQKIIKIVNIFFGKEIKK